MTVRWCEVHDSPGVHRAEVCHWGWASNDQWSCSFVFRDLLPEEGP